MHSTLHYGASRSIDIELRDGDAPSICDAPRGEPLSCVAEAIESALAEPLGFPPLVQSVMPGDKVTIALAPGVPQAAIMVAHTVAVLLHAGLSAADLTLVCTQADAETQSLDPLSLVAPQVRQQIDVQVHHPWQRESLSYLAASADARPIYIHRAIHDADLVISIGCLRLEDSLGYHGVAGSVFPEFSDADSLARYRAPKSVRPQNHDRLNRESDEVSWLLGSVFTIQVVPGRGGAVLHAMAGEREAVFRAGSRLCAEAWNYQIERRAALVVATIEGGAEHQTWDNLGRALASAAHAADDEATIVLCTELDQAIGPGLQRLVGAEDVHTAMHEIAKAAPADALVAAELVRALERGRVYLISRLGDELVEELGMTPISADQLPRLAARYDSCVVLANAHYAIAHAPDEPATTARSAPRRSPR